MPSTLDPSATIESLLASEHGEGTKVDQDELKLCNELKAAVPAARADQVIRFLRARKGSVEKAQAMLEKHQEWRQEMKLPWSSLDEEVTAELRKHKIVFHGKDHDGRQLVIIRGKLLGKHTYHDIDVARRAVVHIMEHFENRVEPLGKATIIFSKIDAGSKNIDTDCEYARVDCFPIRVAVGLLVCYVCVGTWQLPVSQSVCVATGMNHYVQCAVMIVLQ
jgi:hypothetical protein